MIANTNQTDEELLRRYEPILHYTKGERFFPIAVDDYLAQCRLYQSRGIFPAIPQFLTDPLRDALGSSKYESSAFYLSVGKPRWPIFLALTMLAFLLGFLVSGIYGGVLGFFGIFGLVYFGKSKTLSSFLLSWILIVGFGWLLLLPFAWIADQTTWLRVIMTLVYGLFVVTVYVLLIRYFLQVIVGQGANAWMAAFSAAERYAMEESFVSFQRDLRPTYYGRVVRPPQVPEGWMVVQYHYFYPFNDWRSSVKGINNHEGDWEMVAIYFKDGQPYGVGYSAHHVGEFEYWENIPKGDGVYAEHPIIYVAIGSHANYPSPRVRHLYELADDGVDPVYGKGKRFNMRSLVYRLEQLFQRIMDFTPDEDAFEDWTGFAREYPLGDGEQIGCYAEEKQLKPLPRDERGLADHHGDTYKRPTPTFTTNTWQPIIISDPEPVWIKYKGAWGRRSTLTEIQTGKPDESGPPGPKWQRPAEDGTQLERLRWHDPYGWLRELLVTTVNKPKIPSLHENTDEGQRAIQTRERALIDLDASGEWNAMILQGLLRVFKAPSSYQVQVAVVKRLNDHAHDLISALQSADVVMCRLAAETLYWVPNPDTAAALRQRRNDPDRDIRHWVSMALAALGEETMTVF